MMTNKDNLQIWPNFRFNLPEIAGAVGDFATLIPIVLGVAVVCHVNLGHILLFFSIWYIITGIYYKMPVPVEPMKAVGAIVIAEGLSEKEIAASGIILGVLFLAIGLCKGMKCVQNKVPYSVIRGIQLGLALILIKTSINFVVQDYFLAVVCISIVILFFIVGKFTNIPDISAILVLLIGVSVGFFLYGIPHANLISLPNIVIPAGQDFIKGGWLLAVPQVPLTITNAILATTLLMQDLLHKDVDPDKLSKSIGLMNLTSVVFGGFPMCHGAGGLAAQYRFGARTGGSNIISGLILLPIALFFSGPEFVSIISPGVFGALLIFVAIELGKHALKTDSYIVTVGIAVLTLTLNITIAFIAGLIFVYLLSKIKSESSGK